MMIYLLTRLLIILIGASQCLMFGHHINLRAQQQPYRFGNLEFGLKRFGCQSSIDQHQKSGHWNQKESAKYFAFVDEFKDKFRQKEARRQWKIFKSLSEFIKTRTPNQCRSHHHKMNKRYSSIEESLQSLKIRNPQLSSKAKKYSDELKNIRFQEIQTSEFPSVFRRIGLHRRKQTKCRIQKTQMSYDLEPQLYMKLQDSANIPTQISYIQQPEKRPSNVRHQLQFPIFPPSSQSLLFQTHQFPGSNSLDSLWVECQVSYMKWVNKINSLVN